MISTLLDKTNPSNVQSSLRFMTINSFVHQTEKTLKNIFEETEFSQFSQKSHFKFRQLTTDFENCTKHQTENKVCVILDVEH